MEDALTQLTDRLDAHGTQVTEESLITVMVNLDNDHNTTFV